MLTATSNETPSKPAPAIADPVEAAFTLVEYDSEALATGTVEGLKETSSGSTTIQNPIGPPNIPFDDKQKIIAPSIDRMEDLLKETTISDDMVSLSVQGSSFILKKDFVLSHDWMVAKIVTSEIPSTRIHGQIFLDVDPVSFRMIVSILQGITSLKARASKISTSDLALLISTAEYLLCFDIAKELGTIQSDHEKEINRKEAENRRIERENRTLTQALGKFETMESVFKEKSMKLLECRGYKTRRSGNICGSVSLLIGHVRLDGDELKCEECDCEPRGYQRELFNSTRAPDLSRAVFRLNS